MKVEEMLGFPTSNKVPTVYWRNEDNRWQVKTLFQGNNQVGIVPSEHQCVVIDVDMKNGVDGKKSLFSCFPHLPESLNYTTANGGFHLWYSVPPEIEIPQRNRKLPGVDIRYKDGYVCVGADYQINLDGTIVEAPQYLLDWLKEKERYTVGRKKRTIKNDGGNEQDIPMPDFSPLPRGARNDGLFRWACGYLNEVRDGNLKPSSLMKMMHIKGHKYSGLPDWECEQVFDSVMELL